MALCPCSDAEGLCMIPPIFSRIDAPVDVLGHGYGASTKAQRGRKRRAPRDAARQAQEVTRPQLLLVLLLPAEHVR